MADPFIANPLQPGQYPTATSPEEEPQGGSEAQSLTHNPQGVLTWSPFSGLGGLVEGLWGGLSPSKINAMGHAVKADIVKRDAKMPFIERALTDVGDVAASFAVPFVKAGEALLPRFLEKGEARTAADVKKGMPTPEQTTEKRAAADAQEFVSGALGGIGGVVSSLGDDVASLWGEGPSHLTRTVGARPATVVATAYPAAKAFGKAGLAVKERFLPSSADDALSQAGGLAPDATRPPNVLDRAIATVQKMAPDWYVKNLTDGFYAGSKAATALVEDIARSPERAQELIDTAITRLGAVAERVPTPGGGKLRGKVFSEADTLAEQRRRTELAQELVDKLERADNPELRQAAKDDLRAEQAHLASIDPAKALPSASRADKLRALASATDFENLWNQGRTEALTTTASYRIGRQGGVIRQPITGAGHDVPQAGQGFSQDTTELIDRYATKIAQATGESVATVTQQLENGLGYTALGDWQAQFAANPRVVGKQLLQGIETELGRKLTPAEARSTLRAAAKGPELFSSPHESDPFQVTATPMFSYGDMPAAQPAKTISAPPAMKIFQLIDPAAYNRIDPAAFIARQRLSGKTGWFGGASVLRRAIEGTTRNITANLADRTLVNQLDAEMSRATKGEPDAAILAEARKIQDTIDGASSSKLPAKIAINLANGALRNDLLVQALPPGVDPVLVAEIMHHMYPDSPAVSKAADALGEYRPLKPITDNSGVSPGTANPLFADALELHLDAAKARSPIGELSNMMKSGVTARSLPSGLNNLGGNVSMQTVRRGILAPVYLARATRLVGKLADWKNGKLAQGDKIGWAGSGLGLGFSDLPTSEVFSALDGTGVWSNDFIGQEVGARGTGDAMAAYETLWTRGMRTAAEVGNKVLGSKNPINRVAEAFYKGGDVPFRVEESVAQYGMYRQYINNLGLGRYLRLDQGRRMPFVRKTEDGFEMADPTAPVATDRGWQPVTEEVLQKEMGKAAAFRGAKLVGDYGDLPQWAKKLKTIPDMGLLSSFSSWQSIFLDLPGKSGMYNRVLFESPYAVKTNSPKVLALGALHDLALAARRSAIVYGAQQQLLAGQNADLELLFKSAPDRDAKFIIRDLTDPKLLSAIDMGRWASMGPTTILLKLLGYGWQQVAGVNHNDVLENVTAQKETEKVVIQNRVRTDEGLPLIPVPTPPPPLDHRALRLLQMADQGELGGVKDALNLFNIGGSLLGDMYAKVAKAESDPRTVYTAIDYLRELAPLVVGTTNARMADMVIGTLTDQGPDAVSAASMSKELNGLRSFSTRSRSLDATRPDTSEPLLSWLARDFLGKGWRTKALDQADPSDMKSFLNQAKVSFRAGAGVISEERMDNAVELAKQRVERAAETKPLDAEQVNTAQQALVFVKAVKKRNSNLGSVIDNVIKEQWKQYQGVFTQVKSAPDKLVGPHAFSDFSKAKGWSFIHGE